MSQITQSKQNLSNWTPNIFINGFIAWLFGATGPLLIVLNSAKMGDLENKAVISWIFAIYAVGGLTSIFLSQMYLGLILLQVSYL